MARIAFTAHLGGVAPREEMSVGGVTVAAALAAVFEDYPRLRGYILDDQGQVRRHVVLFVDGARQPNGTVLQMFVGAQSEIYVLQALSGG